MSLNPNDPALCQNYNGLTKREHFAGLAMQGLYSNDKVFLSVSYDELATAATKQADALIAALNRILP